LNGSLKRFRRCGGWPPVAERQLHARQFPCKIRRAVFGIFPMGFGLLHRSNCPSSGASTMTVRGFGQESIDGDCPAGAEVLGKATEKAVRLSLENFVARVINQRLD